MIYDLRGWVGYLRCRRGWGWRRRGRGSRCCCEPCDAGGRVLALLEKRLEEVVLRDGGEYKKGGIRCCPIGRDGRKSDSRGPRSKELVGQIQACRGLLNRLSRMQVRRGRGRREETRRRGRSKKSSPLRGSVGGPAHGERR